MATGDKAYYDFVSIFLYLALVIVGWVAIYSATPTLEYSSLMDLSELYGKQLIFILASLFIAVILLAVEPKFYERFAGVIYLVSILSLLGLFIFGKEVNGAKSWYAIGSFTLQPSEFAKMATSLAVAKYLSQLEVNLKNLRDLLIVGGIILLPAIIIVPQPDPGSALVYGAFFFALYREGLSLWYLSLIVVALGIFLMALLLPIAVVCVVILAAVVLMFTLSRKRRHKKRLPKPRPVLYVIVAMITMGFALSINPIFENVLEERHRNRINIVLGKVEDDAGIGYNIAQSKVAIGNGGWTGKGWLQGTQTQGGFVPEQETDFIFSAIGEEWGFMGTSIVLLLFLGLIVRVLVMAERQRNQFARIYGYCVAGIFFLHVFVNIGMVIGLLPTVGIPLPFMSYGGSGLLGFTALLFIFIKLDAHRMSYEH
ncbi:rod shape-determining protein RodA [Nonlabens spongiae]|uniref:Rod shape-determining protein RodA n=1 Tax=Nonlabens spongiae TaxID=331648 RepID=A0A1W6MG67_9FLAO|nr:rod shape-determining protein RodA [Nonlabens spongiae]ARN76594.1 rod shape-determining protein RodA [Nonlabens spongiae]